MSSYVTLLDFSCPYFSFPHFTSSHFTSPYIAVFHLLLTLTSLQPYLTVSNFDFSCRYLTATHLTSLHITSFHLSLPSCHLTFPHVSSFTLSCITFVLPITSPRSSFHYVSFHPVSSIPFTVTVFCQYPRQYLPILILTTANITSLLSYFNQM